MALTVDEDRLAFYMGYAFSFAVNLLNVVDKDELMVPFVVYWQDKQPTPTPYPAATQHLAVEHAVADRTQKAPHTTGWSFGREGTIALPDRSHPDVLLVEGWVPGLDPILEMFVYISKHPFGLKPALIWKIHPYARKNSRVFAIEFKQGILAQPFGQKTLDYLGPRKQIQPG